MTNSAAGSDVGGDARFSPPGIIRFGEAYRHVETASRLSWNPLCAQPGNLLRPSAVGPRNGRARFRRLACSKNAGLAVPARSGGAFRGGDKARTGITPRRCSGRSVERGRRPPRTAKPAISLHIVLRNPAARRRRDSRKGEVGRESRDKRNGASRSPPPTCNAKRFLRLGGDRLALVLLARHESGDAGQSRVALNIIRFS